MALQMRYPVFRQPFLKKEIMMKPLQTLRSKLSQLPYKKSALSLAACTLLLIGSYQAKHYFSATTKQLPIIAITQIVQHPSLDAIRRGITDELENLGYTDQKTINIVYENAQGNIAIATQIAQKFAGMNPQAIVAITTPSAQAVVNAAKAENIPVIFSAVTDPVGAKIVTNLERPGANVTGTIDLPPVGAQLDLLKQAVPHIKRLGVVFNPGEVNNVTQLQLLKDHATKLGITVVESAASKTSEVVSATTKLVGQVDAIYVPNDNMVVSALEGLIKVTLEHKIPVIASDPDSVARGVTLALANNQYEVGRDTGKLVAKVLQGANPGDLSVVATAKTELHINQSSAQKIGLMIPQSIVAQAENIVGSDL